MNRRLGLPEMFFEEREGRLHGRSGPFWSRHAWIELPWEWQVAKSLTAERDYSRGLAKSVRASFDLDDNGNGTRLAICFSWQPRSWWSRPLLHGINRWLKRRYDAFLSEIDEQLASGEVPRANHTPSGHPVDENRLAVGTQILLDAGWSASEIDRLKTWIRTAEDDELFRIRPKMVAFEWGMDWEELVPLLLHATRAGWLRLSWDIMCPHCQGVRQELRSLGDQRELGHCEICDIDFSTTGLESMEVTFRILPELRSVREVFYCSAEPAKKPHMLLQRALDPGESLETKLSLNPGRYRLRRALGQGATIPFQIEATSPMTGLEWSTTSERPATPLTLNPDLSLRITHTGEQRSGVVLERVAEDPKALRPRELFCFSAFRDLFSEESVASGLNLEVGYQTLLFTDIEGSTRLYSELGDVEAFNLVRQHFVVLGEHIAGRSGAVVKTIGDSMMAVFLRPEDALLATVDIQEAFSSSEALPLKLRLSVHRGLCLAVRLDSHIDYFGNAVNYAAKLQNAIRGGEIAISDSFHALPVVVRQIEERSMGFEKKAFSSHQDSKDEVVWVTRKTSSLAAEAP